MTSCQKYCEISHTEPLVPVWYCILCICHRDGVIGAHKGCWALFISGPLSRGVFRRVCVRVCVSVYCKPLGRSSCPHWAEWAGFDGRVAESTETDRPKPTTKGHRRSCELHTCSKGEHLFAMIVWLYMYVWVCLFGIVWSWICPVDTCAELFVPPQDVVWGLNALFTVSSSFSSSCNSERYAEKTLTFF